MDTRTDDRIVALADTLRAHPIYERVRTPAALRAFTEHHVVCVWDFMSLVKSLHRDVVGWSLPWVPPRDARAARLLNEIVLDEESDAHGDDYASHFDLYLAAMREIGADTGPVTRMVDAVRGGSAVADAARAAGVPAACAAFLRTSFALLDRPLHARAAVFYHGREQLIPEMFLPLLEHLEGSGLRCDSMGVYLARHIEHDGERHRQLAWRLLESVCGDDAGKWREASDTAVIALEARLALWDAIAAQISTAPGAGG